MFFLQTNGSGVLSFAGVSASAGQVIQVVSATDSTTRSTTSTSYVTASNTLSVTITPSSSANKILIIANHYGYGAANTIHFTIFRNGSTNLGSASGQNGICFFESMGGQFDGPVCYTVLDSPNTTSATTYQVYVKSSSGTAIMVSASYLATITALEIKG